jgi:hypothetical protein
MNSVIEAHVEYLERKFIPLAPGLPMVMRWHYVPGGRSRNIELEEREMTIWREHDQAYRTSRQVELLDQKYQYEQARMCHVEQRISGL